MTHPLSTVFLVSALCAAIAGITSWIIVTFLFVALIWEVIIFYQAGKVE